MYSSLRQLGSPRNHAPRLEAECRNPATGTLERLGDDLAETGLHEEQEESTAPRSKQFPTQGTGFDRGGVDVVDMSIGYRRREAPLQLPRRVQISPEFDQFGADQVSMHLPA